MSLYALAREINNELARESSMRVGATVKHPDGRKVKIIEGCFLDPVYGRVSNFWYWCEVKADGTLGKKECGYGW